MDLWLAGEVTGNDKQTKNKGQERGKREARANTSTHIRHTHAHSHTHTHTHTHTHEIHSSRVGVLRVGGSTKSPPPEILKTPLLDSMEGFHPGVAQVRAMSHVYMCM